MFRISNTIYTVGFIYNIYCYKYTREYIGIVFYAIITIVLPYFLFNYALKYMDNGEATILYGGAEPIAATIFGALIFAEYPVSLIWLEL